MILMVSGCCCCWFCASKLDSKMKQDGDTVGNKADAVSTFTSTLIYLGGTQNHSSFRRQIPLFSAAQESREHGNCTRQRPLPSSPVRLPSAKGKSIPTVTQRWADQREQGSTAWMAATCPHFRSRIRDLPEALQIGREFCMEFCPGPAVVLQGAQLSSISSTAPGCQGTPCCAVHT